MNKPLKIASQLSLVYLLVLLIAALFYYKERMLFIDAPWIVFNIINKKTFAIQEHRYGSFITQIFPLTGVWLNLPLKIILILYSASFNFFYLLVGVLLYRIKQYKWVLLLGFYFSLMVSSSYFWTNNEVHQGVCWIILLFGLVFHAEKSYYIPWVKYLIFFSLSFLAVFTHPLIVLVSGFLWIYFLILGDEISLKKKSTIIYSILILCVWSLKCYYSINGWYDGAKIETVTNVSIDTFTKTLQGNAMSLFLKSCLINYWISSVLFIVGIVYLIKHRLYLLVIWIVASFSVSAILILLINTDAPWFFYIEGEWMFLSLLSAIVFVWHILQKINSRYIAILIGCIFLVRFTYILSSAAPFETRLLTITKIINTAKKMNCTKLIIERKDESSVLERNLIMSWGMPIETLFISLMQGDNPGITVGYYHPEQIKVLCPKKRSEFSTTFYTIPIEDMNYKYFKYDTSTQYKIVKDFL